MAGKSTVTVLRGKTRAAFVGGSLEACRNDRHVFSSAELFLAFSACLFMSFCTLGDLVYRMTGLPIGGVLSKVASTIILASEEHSWFLDIHRRKNHGFSCVVPAWEFEVARARYVDDILWVSGRYCFTCMRLAVTLVYTAPFEVEAYSPKAAWLDLELRLPTLTWSMKPTLWTLPPPWGAPKGCAHSFICGRLARWQEVRLSGKAWIEAAANLLVSFRDVGWPNAVIRAAMGCHLQGCKSFQASHFQLVAWVLAYGWPSQLLSRLVALRFSGSSVGGSGCQVCVVPCP